MHILEHLFLVGEFPARAHLLSGLTLEQVTLCPDGASHSIYEELWHVVAYQQSIIASGVPAGDRYPSAAPEHEHQWHDLVRVFLDGARAAATLGRAPERLALRTEPYEYVDPSVAEALDLLCGTTATREALVSGASWRDVVATLCDG